MHGRGVKDFSNGDRYEGQFKDDKYHGKAIWYSYTDQTKRQGEWSTGKRLNWTSQPVPCEVLNNG